MIAHIDVVPLALSRLGVQFSEAENLKNYISALLEEGQNLEDVFQNVLTYRNLSEASGVQLDILGELVGQSRNVIDGAFIPYFGFASTSSALPFGVGPFYTVNQTESEFEFFDGYMVLPGASGDYASTPAQDMSTLNQIICYDVALDDWSPAGFTDIVSQSDDSTDIAFYLAVKNGGVAGELRFRWTNDGSSVLTADSTEVVPASDGDLISLRLDLTATTAIFYTSTDRGENWTKLGDTVAITLGTIFNSSNEIEIGASASGASNRLNGSVSQVKLYNASTLAVDFNAADYTSDARRNVFTYTEDFSNTDWKKPSGNITVDGNKIQEAATSATHILQYEWVSGLAGVYTVSCEAEADERSVLQLWDNGTANYANFDLSNGVVSVESGVTASISEVSAGRYLCTMTSTLAASTAVRMGLVTTPTSARGESYLGVAGEGLSVYTPQLELNSSRTAYQRVNAAAVGAEFISPETFEGWTLNGDASIVSPRTEETIIPLGPQETITDGFLNDSQYRNYIKAKAAYNAASGTLEDFIDVFKALFGTNTGIIAIDTNNAHASIYVSHDFTPEDELLILSSDKNKILPRAAGVKITYFKAPGSGFFAFADNPLAAGFGFGGFFSPIGV